MHGRIISAASSNPSRKLAKELWLLWRTASTTHAALLAGMVGDVNLYLNDADDPKSGEIEVVSRHNADQQLLRSHVLQSQQQMAERTALQSAKLTALLLAQHVTWV